MCGEMLLINIPAGLDLFGFLFQVCSFVLFMDLCTSVDFLKWVLFFNFLSIQIFIILCTDVSGSSQVLEVEHIEFVKLKQRKTPPSNDQLWYWKDDQPNGSFAIVSKHNCKALKCDPESSQVVLRDVNEEGDQWMMEGKDIVCKTPSTLMYMYLGDHDVLYCGDKEKKEVKEQKKHFTFLEVVCRS